MGRSQANLAAVAGRVERTLWVGFGCPADGGAKRREEG